MLSVNGKVDSNCEGLQQWRVGGGADIVNSA